MKRVYKIMIPIFLVTALLAYGVYWAFFDIQRLKGQALLQETSSPGGENTVMVYLNNGGATTDYAVLCAVRNNRTGRTRNIYWQYRCTAAAVQWLDEDTAVINGREIDVWRDSYDYRND